MHRKLFFTLTILTTLTLTIQAQYDDKGTLEAELFNPDRYRLSIQKAVDPIKIDGKIEEVSWQSAMVAKDFWMKWPVDTKAPPHDTEVRITYDETSLYISAVCFDTSTYIIQTLKRDNSFFASDGFGVTIDPVNRKTNGFFFAVNPMGTQMEGLVSNQMDGFSLDWDNKWFAEVQRLPDRWIVEMAIPFKTLRFDAEKTEWGINFARCDVKENSYSVWSRVPVNFSPFNLGYLGTMKWDKAPEKAKGNVSIIPYTTGGINKDYEGKTDPKWNGDVGVDAKVAITSSLNLDVTVNPDFSQIEVDQQVTNLDRFSLFFPERRTFFLENSDIFSNFGIPPTRPFFSRRIGLKDGSPVPIRFGARLSGNVSKNLRIGLMNMQTAAFEEDASQNYTVGAFHQSVLKRSTIKGILVNRQGFADGKTLAEDYARNGGLEFEYLSEDGKWSSWAAYHLSATPEELKDRDYYNVGLSYSGRSFETTHSYSSTGTNYIVDVGFNARQFNYDAERDTTVRRGYDILFQTLQYKFYPEKGPLTQHGISVESVAFLTPKKEFSELQLGLDYSFRFKNTSQFSILGQKQVVNLPFSTYIISGEPLPADTYNFTQGGINYGSDYRKAFRFELGAQYGGFYNGTIASIDGSLNFRMQPWGSIRMAVSQNFVNLPEPYGKQNLLLIGPRIEINFSRNIYWTTFIQYNTQANNFNINSRFQWRFKPMSDLYIVYTDNYRLDPVLVKNRALVLKLNYWLTL